MIYQRLNTRQRVLFAAVFAVITLTALVSLAPHDLAWRETLKGYKPSWGQCESSQHREDDWESQFKASGDLLETTRPVEGSYGYYAFDNLYVWNGTFYIVTSKDVLEEFPPRNHILAKPVGMAEWDSEPTDAELQFVTPHRARELFKRQPVLMAGPSIIFTEIDQFLSHFYHWWGETFLGAWRVYSTLALNHSSTPSTAGGDATVGDVFSLPTPKRFILSNARGNTWRDPARVVAALMFAAFPSAPIQAAEWWDDLKRAGAPVVFERVVLVNRHAAHRHPDLMKWPKMITPVMGLKTPPHFFEPVRQNLAKSMLGRVPVPPSSHSNPKGKPIVTYISRQATGRRLTAESHESLVMALEELKREGVCDVHIAEMQKMTLAEQIELSSRSTIMLAVHGNGLTHQLWMPPSDKSTVIEIFYPPGYVYDYEILARNVGHKHYGIWNDTYITYLDGETLEGGLNVPEGFHGSSIPVHGPTVADIIRRRLSLGSKAEDGKPGP